MTSVTTASGDVLSTYSYSDLQSTTWDDGGYINVTVINEAIDVLVASINLPVQNIVEGLGYLHSDLSVQLKGYIQIPSVIEGVGVTILDAGSGPLYLDPSPVIVHASSNISIASTSANLSSNEVFIGLAPTMLPDTIETLVTLSEPLIITNVILSIFNINLDIIINTPIIPTWRWPYVGCKEETVSLPEELITLKIKEDMYIAPMTEEVFSLSIDC